MAPAGISANFGRGRQLHLLTLAALLASCPAERHVSVGRSHLCYITDSYSDYAVSCAGTGWNTTTEGPFHGVAAGNGFTCGLFMTNHTATCWASPANGPGAALAWSTELDARTEFLDISAGESHMCGLQPNGTITCYGGCSSVPLGGPGYTTVSAGIGIACGVTRPAQDASSNGGEVVCWSDAPGHALLRGIPRGPFLDVSVGDSHACALACNGSVACWGDARGYRDLPQNTNYLYITAGANTTCGVADDNSAPCSGVTLAFQAPTVQEVACGGAGCMGGAASWRYPRGAHVFANSTVIPTEYASKVSFIGDMALGWRARDVASSADGMRLLYAVYNDFLYTSVNGGASWTPRETRRGWYKVASSENGVQLIAAEYQGQLYTSKDGGVTWSAHGETRQWLAVASSANGMRLMALSKVMLSNGVASKGLLYTSTDGGVTWMSLLSIPICETLSSSADGMRLIAFSIGNNGATSSAYVSIDGGTTWRLGASELPGQCRTLVSSSDGIRIFAICDGVLHSSTDGGITFPVTDSSRTWRAGVLASSADGKRLIAAEQGGRLFISMNGGLNWTVQESSRSWAAAASSADGLRVVASTFDCELYTGRPSLTVSFSAASLSLLSALRTSNGEHDALLTPRIVSVGATSPLGIVDVAASGSANLSQETFVGLSRQVTSLELTNVSAVASRSFSRSCAAGVRSLKLSSLSPIVFEPASLDGLANLESLTVQSSIAFRGSVGYFSLDSLPHSSRIALLNLSATGNVALLPSTQQLTTADAVVVDVSRNGILEIANVSTALSQLAANEARRVSINLAGNAITWLPAGSFATGFDGLRKLDVSDNGLRYVSDAAFTNVGNGLLEELELAKGNNLGGRCPAGYYNRDTSFRNRFEKSFAYLGCGDCPPGAFCPGDGVRYECPPGRYSDADRATSNNTCSACPAGTYSQLRGQSRVGCVSCSPGTASALEGSNSSRSCRLCEPGYYAANPGQSKCTSCPAGTYGSAIGADSAGTCQSCNRGFYSTQPAATNISTCTECRSGFTTAIAGAASADDCNVDQRRACAAGWGFNADARRCAPCPLGWTGTPGDLGCVPCPAGRYLPVDVRNATADGCITCPQGRFSASVGATSPESCSPCPFGFQPSAGASRCAGCAPRSVISAATSACVACPVNATVCVGGVTAALPRAADVLSRTAAVIPLMRTLPGPQTLQLQQQEQQQRRLLAIQLPVTTHTVNSAEGPVASSVARYAVSPTAAQPLSSSLAAFVLSPAALVIATSVAAVLPLLFFLMPTVRRSLRALLILDVFAKERPLDDGDVVQKFSSPLGVGITISYLFGMVGAAVVLVLAWAASNAVYVSTLRPLMPEFGWGAITQPLEFTLGFAADDASACASVRVLPTTGGQQLSASAYRLPDPSPAVLSTRPPVLCSVRLLWHSFAPSGGQLFNTTLQLPTGAQSVGWAAIGVLTPSASNVEVDEPTSIEVGTLEPPLDSYGLLAARIRMSLMPLVEDDKLTPRVTHGLLVVAVTTTSEERSTADIVPTAGGTDDVRIELVAEPVQQFLHLSVTQRSTVAQLLASTAGLLSGLGVLFRIVYGLAYSLARKLYGGHPPWEREALEARRARELHVNANDRRPTSTCSRLCQRKHGSRAALLAKAKNSVDDGSAADMHAINPMATANAQCSVCRTSSAQPAPATPAPRAVPNIDDDWRKRVGMGGATADPAKGFAVLVPAADIPGANLSLLSAASSVVAVAAMRAVHSANHPTEQLRAHPTPLPPTSRYTSLSSARAAFPGQDILAESDEAAAQSQ